MVANELAFVLDNGVLEPLLELPLVLDHTVSLEFDLLHLLPVFLHLFEVEHDVG